MEVGLRERRNSSFILYFFSFPSSDPGVYKLYANVFTLHFISVKLTQLSVSLAEQTSVLSGNISDKQTRCYDISEIPTRGRRRRRGGGEGGESRRKESFHPGTALEGELQTKWGFYNLGGVGGRVAPPWWC
jgi:hypothetical protein